ncbi:hypothetical protein ACFPOI_28965 [Nonomuraea angiospora]|uniref:2-polyprenyl-6-methoxyphenol hydroxylase-like FAD-dependent oxidoreductase n=1 Tax=Nonomuraea angiospora TaxID=46172 RepID=A0ABR9LTW8_9ACTN|nr:hypothetical protein [Nonomuraea angiospora]MBE1584099.1 2-polyprenyl-6-methoxyphenol hydroxylase-like FAD-dependent oxidoreductase [Nonomuraea angiospora]
MRVVAIGAGMGGSTLTQGLRQAGIDVVAYERDDVQGRPQGISLHCDDRAMTALCACLPPAHMAMVEATTGGLRKNTQFLTDVAEELAVARAHPPSPRAPGGAGES